MPVAVRAGKKFSTPGRRASEGAPQVREPGFRAHVWIYPELLKAVEAPAVVRHLGSACIAPMEPSHRLLGKLSMRRFICSDSCCNGGREYLGIRHRSRL